MQQNATTELPCDKKARRIRAIVSALIPQFKPNQDLSAIIYI